MFYRRTNLRLPHPYPSQLHVDPLEVPYTPAGGYREPHQADVMSRADFSNLIYSQPWGDVRIEYDGWYQYAVCQKSPEAQHHHAEAARNGNAA
jgi:hypothetical protein